MGEAAQSMSVANQTLNLLREYYPDYVSHVPKEVLQFGFPDPMVSALAAAFTTILSIISLTGNITLIIVYFR